MKNEIPHSYNELGYQSYVSDEKIKLTRMMCILSAFLYVVFFVVDFWALPSSLSSAMYIRAFVTATLCVTYGLTYTRNFDKYYNWILIPTFIFAISGIESMIYLSQPEDQAFEIYFAGIILVLIALFSWTHLNLWIAGTLSCLSIGTYSYIEVFVRDFSTSDRFPTLLANLFFLISAVLIGLAAKIMRDNYLHQNYLLQQSLKEALKDKTIEADDYAYKANHDALTLLPNRRYITELLEESLQVAKEKGKILAILFFDLNGFKQLNDIFGHAVGDEVLIIVAKRLELAIRKGDCISRLGGDEYLVGLMMDEEQASEVNIMAAKFTAIISEPMNIDGNIVNVGAAVGIAAYPLHGNKIGVLIDIADKKMYNIKQGLERVAKERDAKESAAITIFPGNSKNRR